jgi:hypothetical protein
MGSVCARARTLFEHASSLYPYIGTYCVLTAHGLTQLDH